MRPGQRGKPLAIGYVCEQLVELVLRGGVSTARVFTVVAPAVFGMLASCCAQLDNLAFELGDPCFGFLPVGGASFVATRCKR